MNKQRINETRKYKNGCLRIKVWERNADEKYRKGRKMRERCKQGGGRKGQEKQGWETENRLRVDWKEVKKDTGIKDKNSEGRRKAWNFWKKKEIGNKGKDGNLRLV